MASFNGFCIHRVDDKSHGMIYYLFFHMKEEEVQSRKHKTGLKKKKNVIKIRSKTNTITKNVNKIKAEGNVSIAQPIVVF